MQRLDEIVRADSDVSDEVRQGVSAKLALIQSMAQSAGGDGATVATQEAAMHEEGGAESKE